MLEQIFQAKLQILPSFTENTFSELEAKFLALLVVAQFKIKTLYQARQLAFHLSYLCPNPARIAVGLTELFINAIEHGNLGISYEEKNKLSSESAWLEEIERRLVLPEHRSKEVIIDIHKTETRVQFQIGDQGIGFRWQDFIQEPNTGSTLKNGRGIILAKLMSFDELQYNDVGNAVTCSVYL